MGAEQEALVIDVRESGATTTLLVRGELDAYTCATLDARADAALSRGHSIVVDLTDTVFIDSTSLGTLIGIRRRARAAGHDLVVSGVNDRVRRTMELTGVLRSLTREVVAT